MKYVALLGLAASLAAFPIVTVAQTAPPTPNAAMRQQFQQMRAQMQQIRARERSQILSALTPANRALLANIAGELATAVNPDYRAAAGRLDAALSSSEKQAILSAAQSARTSRRTLMQSARQRLGEERRPDGPGTGMNRTRRTPDAGMLLLSLAAGPGHGMMGRPGMMRP